jgi:hypothetical protein
MITVWNACTNRIRLSAFAYPGDEKPPQAGKMICGQAYAVNRQLSTGRCNSKRILF